MLLGLTWNRDRSSTSRYSVPLCWLPLGPLGVIVTVIVPVCPGPITTGERPVSSDGFTLACHRSPVDELTLGSKAFAVAVIAVVTLSWGAGVASNVPYTSGTTVHGPE